MIIKQKSMDKQAYSPPKIERVILELEQVIAGSVPVAPQDPDNAFKEDWQEVTINTGDIEIL